MNKVVGLCEKHGFLRRVLDPKLGFECFKIGSTGVLLQENLRNEWFKNIVINKDVSVFVSDDSFSDTFDFAKEVCLDRAPFGVAEFEKTKRSTLEGDGHVKPDGIDFKDFFAAMTILRCWVFVAPPNAVQFFHQWQRQRRMWWRKFAASPGRYILTDIRTTGDSTQTVDIMAKYPWGDQLVETLTLGDGPKSLTASQLQLKDDKTSVEARCVVSEICSATMLLNSLCDAYDEPSFQDSPRPLLRLHRKLAPYKISFSIPSGPKSVVDELKNLTLYLCRQLRSNHVSSLFLPSSYTHTLDTQWKQYDQMGIPYNVLLNEETLKNGILKLRSRDTTLKEQVHVANLVTYVEQLFKNY